MATNENQQNLEYFSNGLEQVVSFGNSVLNWSLEKARMGNQDLPTMMMLRHIIGLADSITILVRNSSIEPCSLLLRGILESLLSLEYLLKDNREKKALSFLVWHMNKDIKGYHELKKRLPEYAEHAQERISFLKEHLGLIPELAEVEVEYQRTKQIKSNPNWYHLYDGPPNLEQLANRLEKQDLYNVFYRYWSGPTHALDIMRNRFNTAPNDRIEIQPIRHSKEAENITQYTFMLCLEAYNIIVLEYIPEKKDNYANWYLSIKDMYEGLNRV